MIILKALSKNPCTNNRTTFLVTIVANQHNFKDANDFIGVAQ